MAGLLKEIRDLPTATEVTGEGTDYVHIKVGDSDRKIRVYDLMKHHTEAQGNPHGTTTLDLALQNVLNVAQLERALNLSDIPDTSAALTNLNAYDKPEVDAALLAHTSITSGNPHLVTKAEVQLGSVNNFPASSSTTLASDTTYATSSAVNTVRQQLVNAKTDNAIFYAGMIMMWDSAVAPAGWEIVTQMQGRFAVGAGGGYAFGDTGGTDSSAHTHVVSGTTNSHELTIAQMPTHTHSWGMADSNSGVGNHTESSSRGRVRNGVTDSTGGSEAHAHGISVTSQGASQTDNRPPYFGVYFIRKL